MPTPIIKSGLMPYETYRRITVSRLAHSHSEAAYLAELHADIVRTHWLSGAPMTTAAESLAALDTGTRAAA